MIEKNGMQVATN